MATQRYISTSFWTDKWIRELDPAERYLYMYLLTNPQTNIAGIYSITLDRIAFDTGYDERTLKPMLERFAKAKKAFFYDDEYIILPSWPKHQKADTKATIKQGIEAVLKLLPENVKIYAVKVGYQYHIDTIPVGYQYQPSYSDTEFDTDTDINSDTDINTDAVFPSPPESQEVSKPEYNAMPQDRLDAMTRIETIRAHWNGQPGLPKYRYLAISMRQDDLSGALRTLGAYSDDEIKKAIDNYNTISTDGEYTPFPVYSTFAGFLKTGPENYGDDAKPFDRCRKKNAGEKEMTVDEYKAKFYPEEVEQENEEGEA